MHSTNTWLPIFSEAVEKVTVLAAALFLCTMSAEPLITRLASAVCRKRKAKPFALVGRVNVTAAVATNNCPLSAAVTV